MDYNLCLSRFVVLRINSLDRILDQHPTKRINGFRVLAFVIGFTDPVGEYFPVPVQFCFAGGIVDQVHRLIRIVLKVVYMLPKAIADRVAEHTPAGM